MSRAERLRREGVGSIALFGGLSLEHSLVPLHASSIERFQ
jgi:hypothetical protein